VNGRLQQWVAPILIALGIIGCTAFIAETPQQKLYAAVSEFRVLTEASALYCERPDASIDGCRQLLAFYRQGALVAQAAEVAMAEPASDPAQVSALLRALAEILDRYAAEVAEVTRDPA
jgi:hypothetical protein